MGHELKGISCPKRRNNLAEDELGIQLESGLPPVFLFP